MRILANENFPRLAITALRSRGHDVVWLRTDAPGTKDRAILERAETGKRLLLTFDKDFGELAFRLKLPISSGVILFRDSIFKSLYLRILAPQSNRSRIQPLRTCGMNFSILTDEIGR